MAMVQTHTVAECVDLAMRFERRVDEIRERNQLQKASGPQRRGFKKGSRFSPMASSGASGGIVHVNQMTVDSVT